MNYEDFPILKNSEYSFLHEQYLNTKLQNRKTLTQKICNEISTCINGCLPTQNPYNNRINQAIKLSHQTLIKHLNNLTSLFNIQTSSMQNISNFNLFSYTRKINNIISLTLDWLDSEEKEYYRTLSKKNIKELINCLDEIFSSTEDSNVNFYKHM